MNKILIILTILLALFLVVSCAPVTDNSADTTTLENTPSDDTATADNVAEESVVDVPAETSTTEIVDNPEETMNETEINSEGGQVYTVEFVGTKMVPETTVIKVGDTVRWVNQRNAPNLNKAMVIGSSTAGCREARSTILHSGESYEYTFTEPRTCTIVDGYLKTVTSKVIIQE